MTTARSAPPVIPEGFLDEYEALLEAGERERALERVYREAAGLSPELIGALRSAPNWQSRVDAAHTVLRELRAEARYEFDAGRFENVTAPTMLLTGSEVVSTSKRRPQSLPMRSRTAGS